MLKKKRIILNGSMVVVSFCILLYSCKKDAGGSSSVDTGALQVMTTSAVAVMPNLPTVCFNYSKITLPNYLITPAITGQISIPGNNVVTDDGATLGRVLFYEKNISQTRTISCASCHKQANGFSDPVAFSAGVNGGITTRNAMSLTNTAYYPNGKYFWDERAATLEIQVLGPVQNPVEMGMTLDSMVARLNRLTYYPSLFIKAFGNATITSDRVSLALAQFLRSITSYQSKYDIGRQVLAPVQPVDKIAFTNFTAQENRGKQLFFDPQLANCGACHGTETFTAARPQNNGLDLVSADGGVGAITGIPQQVATFKVPSLRNIELSAPYMHDGRFATLEAVVEHYSTGVKANRNLSGPLRNNDGTPRNLNLSADDKAALVAFLKTLTDKTMTADIKYSDPFIK